MTQPKTLVRLGVFNLLWPPSALGDLPWGSLFHGQDFGRDLLHFKEFFVCPQQLLKLDGFFYQYEQGTRARREGSDFCYCVILLMNHRECSLGSVEMYG